MNKEFEKMDVKNKKNIDKYYQKQITEFTKSLYLREDEYDAIVHSLSYIRQLERIVEDYAFSSNLDVDEIEAKERRKQYGENLEIR